MTQGFLSHARGSEWRRWDLHVHTPRSVLGHGFGADFDAYAQALFTKAVEYHIAAIGVTDYFTIEGYKELCALIDDGDRLEELLGQEVAAAAREILLLPNVELRAREVITGPSGQARVNYHVLFSDELTAKQIEENFLHRLLFTNSAAPDSPDEQQSLTVDNLKAFGARLKSEHASFRGGSDLVVGMEQAVVSHEQVTSVLTRQRQLFKDRYLIVLPADEDLATLEWNGQAHHVRKVMLQKAHMIFSANPNTRDFGLGRKHQSAAEFEREFKTLKPCIHGSDAHDLESLFRPAGQRHLWIKADPTFSGNSCMSPRTECLSGSSRYRSVTLKATPLSTWMGCLLSASRTVTKPRSGSRELCRSILGWSPSSATKAVVRAR